MRACLSWSAPYARSASASSRGTPVHAGRFHPRTPKSRFRNCTRAVLQVHRLLQLVPERQRAVGAFVLGRSDVRELVPTAPPNPTPKPAAFARSPCVAIPITAEVGERGRGGAPRTDVGCPRARLCRGDSADSQILFMYGTTSCAPKVFSYVYAEKLSPWRAGSRRPRFHTATRALRLSRSAKVRAAAGSTPRCQGARAAR